MTELFTHALQYPGTIALILAALLIFTVWLTTNETPIDSPEHDPTTWRPLIILCLISGASVAFLIGWVFSKLN